MKPTRLIGLLLSAALLAGCGMTNTRPAISWFTLDDRKPIEEIQRHDPETPPIEKVLLIGQSDANPFYDNTQLAYERPDKSRGYYQYAAWTERPPKRLVTLIERRLAAMGDFAAVAGETAGVRGDLMLNLALDEIYHDTSSTPQQARIVLQAALVDMNTRALIAKHIFVEAASVSAPDASSAVAALNVATTALIDKIVYWVERSSEQFVEASAAPAGKGKPAVARKGKAG